MVTYVLQYVIFLYEKFNHIILQKSVITTQKTHCIYDTNINQLIFFIETVLNNSENS
jgi:hypothetical protein